MEFEIGQKVKWQVGSVLMRGLYLQKIDDKYTSIKAYERSWIDLPNGGERFIRTVPVLTELLEKDND